MIFPDIKVIAEYVHGVTYDKLDEATINSLQIIYDAIKNNLHNTPSEYITPTVTLCLESLIDAPEIKHELIDGEENIIFVEAVDVIKDACGTGKLELFGRSLLLNMCEMENTVHVNLDVSVNGKSFSNVPFIVKLITDEKDPYIKLSKSILNK